MDSNSGLAGELNFYYVSFGDWEEAVHLIDEYDKITADDFMRVAKQYFVPQTRTIGRLVPRPLRRRQTKGATSK